MCLTDAHLEDIIESDVAFGGGALSSGGGVDVFGEAGGGRHGCCIVGEVDLESVRACVLRSCLVGRVVVFV